MARSVTVPPLAELPLIPYLTATGLVDPRAMGQIGVYAICDQGLAVQYIGFSRDIYLSLRQHLVRQPQACYGFKFYPVERPNRTQLEEIRQQWLNELEAIPPGNDTQQGAWENAIDVKTRMSPAMQQEWAGLDEMGQMKYLKDLARQAEQEIFQVLEARHVTELLRFNPKLKENGLLDLK
ncbi:GIY-YIG nuclease family protein [Thermosynechococcaceae cyanobacterium BACA0444]|uniref:GIY-YIG nuclease family protein n=1 Tax=Pseudocalidococcus azoricus BACA0444 TaxID=2918990 RepID=A0AAE4FNX2_9CYAN|nr:GIY-YIG nuclease family protein [Pseudocalidococcus azoricus]MDS3859415.1 GIY-YIG nuclease family protein [Pseudocalidococcus azoricus BACA0444]